MGFLPVRLSHQATKQVRAREYENNPPFCPPGRHLQPVVGQLPVIRLTGHLRAVRGHRGQNSLWTDLNLNLVAAKFTVIKCENGQTKTLFLRVIALI